MNFKQLLSLPLIGLVILLHSSCSKEKTAPLPDLGFADTSETKPWLDNTNFGVYKGVLTGTTGRIKIYFNNGDDVMKAYLWLDSLSDSLICIQPQVLGHPVLAAAFQGRISSFTFTTDEDGRNASLDNFIVQNRINVFGVIAHESTTQQVYCYESLFSGSLNGNFNFIRYGNFVQGLSRNNRNQTFIGKGLATGTAFRLDLNRPFSAIPLYNFQGGIDGSTGDYVSGTWSNPASESGIFNGQRTQ